MGDFAEIPDSEKTPVTLVTGFLGSGKTTLVNYILKEQTEWKICVVENEFGEVAIDGDLVEENVASKEDIITMDNGCVCCSVRGDLVRTFGQLAHRRKDFQAIIIETTGLADPAPIVFTFNSNSLIQDNFRIDSVVCLVDAKHVEIHLDEVKPDGDVNEAEHQVAFADRIILNKTDLVTADELRDVEDRIRSINSFATLIRSERSRVPLDQILGLNSFSLSKLEEIDPTFMQADEPEVMDHAHAVGGHVHDEHCGHSDEHGHSDHGHSDHGHSDHGHSDHGHSDHGHKEHGHKEHGHKKECHEDHDHEEHDHHAHGGGSGAPVAKKKKHNLSLISSVGFTVDGLLDVTRFNAFMSGLLQQKSKELYRTKGILAFKDQGDAKFVFQGVHEQINFGPSDNPWVAGELRQSKLVFIGKNLDYESLRQSIISCCDVPETANVVMHKRG